MVAYRQVLWRGDEWFNITVDQYTEVHTVDIIARGLGDMVPTHHQH